MSDENFGDLHAWIEPEVEARIVAAILGEASDFERDELERLLDERPELRVFRRRLEAVHGLIGEAVKKEEDDEWKLRPKRRGELLEALGVKPAGGKVAVILETARERRIGKAGRRVLAMAAACLLLTLILLPLATSRMSRSVKGAAERAGVTTTYWLASEDMEDLTAESRTSPQESPPASRLSIPAPMTGSLRELDYPTEYEPPELPNSNFSRFTSTPEPTEPPSRGSVANDTRSKVKQRLEQLSSNLGSVELHSADYDRGQAKGRYGPGRDGEARFEDKSRSARDLGGEMQEAELFKEAVKRPATPTPPAIIAGARVPVPVEPAATPQPEPAMSFGLVDDGRRDLNRGGANQLFGESDERSGRGRGMDRGSGALADAEKSDGKPADVPVEPRFRIQMKSNTESARPAKLARKPAAVTGPAMDEAGRAAAEQRLSESAAKTDAGYIIPPVVEGLAVPDEALPLAIVPTVKSKPSVQIESGGESKSLGRQVGGTGGMGGGGGAQQQGQGRGEERDGQDVTGVTGLATGVAGRMFRNEAATGRHSSGESWAIQGEAEAGEAAAAERPAGSPVGGWAFKPSQPSGEAAVDGYAGQVDDGMMEESAGSARRGGTKDYFAYGGKSGNGVQASEEALLGDRLNGRQDGEVTQAWIDVNGTIPSQTFTGGGTTVQPQRLRERVLREDAKGGQEMEENLEAVHQRLEKMADRPAGAGRKLAEMKKANAELGQSIEEVETLKREVTDLREQQAELAKQMTTFDAPSREQTKEMSYRDKVAEEEGRRPLYTGDGYSRQHGKEEAEEEFKKVQGSDPDNAAARRGLERMTELQQTNYQLGYDETRTKMLQRVNGSWEYAEPADADGKVAADLSSPEDSSIVGGVAYLDHKLRNIIIPRVDFEDTTVEEAMDFLRQRAVELDSFELDPARKGINFVVRQGQRDAAGLDAEGGLGAPDPGQALIKGLKLENVPLGTVLDHIGQQTNTRWKSDEFAVTMLPLSAGEGEDLVTRTYQVPPTFRSDISAPEESETGATDPFAGDGDGAALRSRRPIVDELKDMGISFPEGASATYIPGSSTLVVKNTPSNLSLVDALTENLSAGFGNGLPEVDPELFDRLESGGPGAKNLRKLRNIVVPLVDFEDATVEDALHFIEQRSRVLDTDEVDPTAKGLELEIAGADEDGDGPLLGRIGELKLRNVPLHVVLDYMGEQAGFTYDVGDAGVKILPRGREHEEPMWTSEWRVHPEVIAKLREGQAPVEGEADPFGDDTVDEPARHETLEDLLRNQGISFPDGATVRYSPADLTLTVRNSRTNLEFVDTLFESVARQVTIAEQKEEKLTEGEKTAEAEPFSTFSLHVSDVSFKLAQAALAKGEWPEAERIRVEEFVNALDYGDPAPSVDERVACQAEQAIHPFLQQRNLMRVSMRTAALGRNAGTPLRLTVLLDNSGSMEREDRVQSVQNAFELLAAQMNPQDEVSLISFARTPRLLRDRVGGDKVAELVDVVSQTPSEGGTNLEQALQLGVEKAKENFLEGAQNRIVLLTDGAANLGNAKPEDLGKMVETMRQEGIAFDACGVGAEGLNDEVLESLTRKGDGRYYFLDRPEDADAGFARQIAGALRPAAKNVKVQVEFNPKRVGRYKLLGFEKHRLEKEDFRNDSVDAAEMAAEEEGVAVYQFETLPEGEGDVGTVSVRFRDMESGRMVERKWAIPYEANPDRVSDAKPSMQLAASAALLAERLKGTATGELVDLRQLDGWTRNLQSVYPKNERVRQLQEMTAKVRQMGR